MRSSEIGARFSDRPIRSPAGQRLTDLFRNRAIAQRPVGPGPIEQRPVDFGPIEQRPVDIGPIEQRPLGPHDVQRPMSGDRVIMVGNSTVILSKFYPNARRAACH